MNLIPLKSAVLVIWILVVFISFVQNTNLYTIQICTQYKFVQNTKKSKKNGDFGK